MKEKLPNWIWVPTFDGVRLGPLSQSRPDVDGECGCFLYWWLEIGRQLRGEAHVKFLNLAWKNLKSARPDYKSITTEDARDTVANRRIAYRALKAAWEEMGYR